jgi:O-antigen/teichoic acid export membrane protein
LGIISFDSSNKGIAKNAVLGFVFQFIIKFKGVLILPLIVHFLPKETLGEWRLISTSIGILLPVISLNILDGSGMFFSADIEKRRVRIKYYSILHLVLILTSIFTILSLFFKSYSKLFNEYTTALILFFISTVLLKLSIFLYQTYQKSSKLLIINLIVEYGGALLTLILIFYGIKNIYTLLLPIIVLNFITATLLFPKIFKEIKYGCYLNFSFIKKILPISIPLIPVYITEWILSSVGIYFLQYYFTMEVVGSYSVLLSIASLLLTLRATLQFFWFSTCSNMLQNEKHDEFQKILTEVLKMYIVFGLLALILYGFFSKDLIHILANKSYDAISKPLYFTALGYVFLVFSSIWNGILYSLGKSKRILWNYLAASLVILFLSAFLIKKYEINGASFAYFMGNLVLFILMYLSVKDLKLNFNKKEKSINILFVGVVLFISLFQFVEIEEYLKRIIGGGLLLSTVFIIYFSNYITPKKLLTLFKK